MITICKKFLKHINRISVRYIFVCFLFLSCNVEKSKLPVLNYKINASGKKEFYTVHYKEGFKNQLNENFTDKNIHNKIFIANFFFTRCPSICPPMRQNIIKLVSTINHKDFLVVSHTIDPKNDTPEILKAYAKTTDIDSKKWQFITANTAITKALAENYMTNFNAIENSEDFYHSSYAALLDRKKQIRGFYNLLIEEELERLIADIETLL